MNFNKNIHVFKGHEGNEIQHASMMWLFKKNLYFGSFLIGLKTDYLME